MAKDDTRRKTAIRPEPGQPGRREPAPLALGPLPGYTGYVLRRAQLALFDNFINMFKPLGLRPAQFSVLLVARANPGRRQSEIAGALGIRQANLVGLIDELDRRGLTKRKKLADDRRSHAVTLTAQGKALLKRALALQARFERHLIAELGATQHARLIAALVKLYQALLRLNPASASGLTTPPRASRPNRMAGRARR